MEKKPKFSALRERVVDLEIRRNTLCPDYEECLDQAAYADVDLDCCGCPLRTRKNLDAVFPVANMPGCRTFPECTPL